ncbi:MAG: 1-deoxy-D-xylulose-5-phosphate synthase, partial [Planctomycetes bacterium]|nr:1-deoxy-D-xylulose-5-phosphate synthase [Planctomycetota bacterium]
ALLRTFENLRGEPGPLLVHVVTEKGRGYAPAVADPSRFHSSRRFLAENGDGPPSRPTYTSVFQDAMLEIGREDPDVVAITAAMLQGTGLAPWDEAFPGRLIDVGIAEGHGASFAGALAAGGAKPVFAVYSTFCQRAFDQVAHDVALQDVPTVFALDRAGLVEDGPTHHGVFDIAYLRVVPGVVLMAPRDGDELRAMLRFALGLRRPAAIRYPKAALPEGLPETHAPLELGRMETIREGSDVALLAYGSMVDVAWRAARILSERGIEAAVVNARFAKPISRSDLVDLARRHPVIVTIEEHVANGGFGAAVLETLSDADPTPARVHRITLPDLFVTFGSRGDLLASLRLDPGGVAETVERLLRAPTPVG